MQDLPPQFTRLAKRLLSAIEDIEKAVQGQSEAAAKVAQTANAAKDIPPSVRAEIDLPQGIKIHKRAADAAEDKNYQFRTLLVAWLTFAALVIYAIISGWQLYEMRKATWATQEAARAAERSADAAYAQTRPWLKIDSVELRKGVGPIKTLTFVTNTLGAIPELQVKVAVSNVGHTVAQDVHVFPELFFAKFNGNTWHDVVTQEEERFCDSVLTWSANGAMSVVFPSDSPKNWYIGATSTNRATAGSAAVLIVCVAYKGIVKRSQTQAWFGLYENNSVFIKPGVDVDAASLRLIRDESGDHAY